VTLAALCLSFALAGPVGDGASKFDDGSLDDAVTTWEDALSSTPSGVLLYNLGTAWYRRGDAARAVGYLRAAQRLRPRDGSVHHNLALARSELSGTPAPVDAPVGWGLVATPGELGLLGVLFAGLGSLLVVVGVRREGLTLPGALIIATGVGVGTAATWGAVEQDRHPVGVVVDRPASLRDAASLDGRTRGDLPVGSEVRVERSYGSFLLVEDGRGRRGWVPAGALLVPPTLGS